MVEAKRMMLEAPMVKTRKSKPVMLPLPVAKRRRVAEL